MKQLKDYDDSVWNKLFDFAFPDEEQLTLDEVHAELVHLGIDVRPAAEKIRRALRQAARTQDAKAGLAAAKENRLPMLAKLAGIKIPSGEGVRSSLQRLIREKLSEPLQGVYAHRLERASSDEDLRSLLEDLSRLEAFGESKEPDDVDS